MMNQRQFLRAGVGATLSAAAGILSYTRYFEPHWVDFVDRNMKIESLPEKLNGKSLVQLSDIHIGPRVAESFLAEVFRDVRGMEPDIVVMTGDFISYRSADQIMELQRLSHFLPRGRLATAAALGNHDYGPGWSSRRIAGQVHRALADGGVRVLRNERMDVNGLSIIGVDDLWAGDLPGKHSGDGTERPPRSSCATIPTPSIILDCGNTGDGYSPATPTAVSAGFPFSVPLFCPFGTGTTPRGTSLFPAAGISM